MAINRGRARSFSGIRLPDREEVLVPVKVKRAPGGGRKKKITSPVVRTASEVDLKESGLLANIARLREAERTAAEDYFESTKMSDAVITAALHSEWMKTSEQLRKAEVSTPGVLSETSMTIPLEDAEAEWAKVCTKFRVDMEAIPRSIPPRLVGLDEAGIQEELQKAIGQALENLSMMKL